MNYEKKIPIKVTIEGGLNPDRKLELTMGPFADLVDWVETFKTILIHQTFSADTVRELFEEEDSPSSAELGELASCCRSPQTKWKNEF